MPVPSLIQSCLMVVLLCHTAFAAWNPNAPPPTVENFDPADADPGGAITCQNPNDKIDFQLPMVTNLDTGAQEDPNTFTIQELCAQPQYGGRGRGMTLAGWCRRPPTPKDRRPTSDGLDNGITSNNTVAFDNGVRSDFAPDLMLPRLLAYCTTRCFCTTPPPATIQKITQLSAGPHYPRELDDRARFDREAYTITPDLDPWTQVLLDDGPIPRDYPVFFNVAYDPNRWNEVPAKAIRIILQDQVYFQCFYGVQRLIDQDRTRELTRAMLDIAYQYDDPNGDFRVFKEWFRVIFLEMNE